MTDGDDRILYAAVVWLCFGTARFPINLTPVALKWLGDKLEIGEEPIGPV